MDVAINTARTALKAILNVGRGTSGRLILEAHHEQAIRDALAELDNCMSHKPAAVIAEKIKKYALASELAEYERLFAWRAAWSALANKFEPNRLQSRQERIERKAVICNSKIRALMHAFDVRVGNTCNPV